MRTLPLALTILLALAALATGCEAPPATPAPSPRVVSFAPHITDIAFDMGLGPHVVGVTGYCMLPDGEGRTVVGDAFRVNAEAILSEQPDVIFYNQKDTDFDALRQLRPEIKLVRVRNENLAQLREGIRAMGEATGKGELAEAVLGRIDANLDAVRQAVAGRPRPRVLFVLGTDHPSTINSQWTTGELVGIAGGDNVADEAGIANWANINVETVLKLQPDVLIVVAAPGQEQAARDYWMRIGGLQAVQNGRVYVLSDRRLTIPGSRVGQTARALAEAIHPGAFAEDAP